MRVYGANICIDCRNYKAIQKSRGFDAEYVDITESTDNLKAFLRLRDTLPLFAEVRKHGGIGIPLFVDDDGRATLDINEAMAWIHQLPVQDAEIIEWRDGGCVGCN